MLEQEPSDEDAAEDLLEQLTDSLEEVQTQYEELQRMEKIYKLQIQYTYDTTKLEAQLAEITYEQELLEWENTLSEAKEEQETIEEQKAMLDAMTDGTICAQQNGIVASVSYDEGDVISSSVPIISYYDTDTVTVTLEIPQEEIAGIAVGQTVKVQMDRFGTIEGTVSEKSVEPESGTSRTNVIYTVEVSIENETGRINSGTAATVTFSEAENAGEEGQDFSVSEVVEVSASSSSASDSASTAATPASGSGGGAFAEMTTSQSSSSGDTTSLTVEEVYAASGQAVSEGDKILKITDDSIASYRAELEAAVKSAQLQVKQEEVNVESKKAEAEYNHEMYLAEGETAQETYEATIASLDKAVSDLEEELADAKETLDTYDDVDAIETYVSGISGATISYTTRASVEGGVLTDAQTYTVAGVEDGFADVGRLTLADGDFFTVEQDDAKSKVCVLGASVATELFGSSEDAKGSTLYIEDRSYTVIGVFTSSNTVVSGISVDTALLIPYQTGVKYITASVDPTLTVIAEDVNTLQSVITDVKTVLEERYPAASFTFSDSGSKMKAAEASNRTLTMLLTAMAAIVFLVGGIGIMNVLFVSVKERTNEIGILKAIGTPRFIILLEFLFESAAISLIGGVLGVGIGFGVIPLVKQFNVRVEPNLTACLAALGFAVLTGTMFGLYPAWKASRLEPVEALNAE